MLKLKSRLELILERGGVRSADAESRLILVHLFRPLLPQIKSFSDLFSINPMITSTIEARAIQIASERVQGKILQHILGSSFFLNHDYKITPAVLVPRPETVFLVQTIFDWIDSAIQEADFPDNFKFAELGLGSGCITTEILSNFKRSTAVGTEVSFDALEIAKFNARFILGDGILHRLKFIQPETSFDRFAACQSSVSIEQCLWQRCWTKI